MIPLVDLKTRGTSAHLMLRNAMAVNSACVGSDRAMAVHVLSSLGEF